jgi:hypothetical protein
MAKIDLDSLDIEELASLRERSHEVTEPVAAECWGLPGDGGH